VKSIWSKAFSSVALLGAPSLKSSVPMRVSTLSGVVIDGGIAGAVCAAAIWGSASVAQITAAERSSFCFMRSLLWPCSKRLDTMAEIYLAL
jgi:hypothetical protein